MVDCSLRLVPKFLLYNIVWCSCFTGPGSTMRQVLPQILADQGCQYCQSNSSWKLGQQMNPHVCNKKQVMWRIHVCIHFGFKKSKCLLILYKVLECYSKCNSYFLQQNNSDMSSWGHIAIIAINQWNTCTSLGIKLFKHQTLFLQSKHASQGINWTPYL
jgi:hypothetical protein